MMRSNPETGCCCSTRVTVIVIAVLNFIGCIGLEVGGCIYLILQLQQQEAEKGENDSSIMLWILTCTLIGCCINLLLSILLCVGAVQSMPKLVLPWLYYNYFLMLLAFIFFIMNLNSLKFLGPYVYIVFYFFMVFIVRSYTRTGDDGNNDLELFQGEETRGVVQFPKYNVEKETIVSIL